ncbi:MAG: hypothetical protein IJ583_13175, partial [Firmicutes bacterium]|nr:hypothetical protein [Bacillota bacterium]
TTLTIPSSGTSIIAVGGYNAADGRIYPPSGRGPSTIGKLEPLLVAPVSQGGTSTAAALTGGIFALLLEWAVVRGNNPIINSAAAVTFAIRGTEKTENILFPNNIWGFGTINIYESFRKLL